MRLVIDCLLLEDVHSVITVWSTFVTSHPTAQNHAENDLADFSSEKKFLSDVLWQSLIDFRKHSLRSSYEWRLAAFTLPRLWYSHSEDEWEPPLDGNPHKVVTCIVVFTVI